MYQSQKNEDNKDLLRLSDINKILKTEIKSPKSQEEATKMHSQRKEMIDLKKEKSKLESKIRKSGFTKKAIKLSGITNIEELAEDIKNNPSKYLKIVLK